MTVNFEPGSTFARNNILNYAERDPEQERLALRFLDKHAPDLVGVIMGGVL
jgi:hypothetical protein